jgi:methionine-rich copper-binding protein CopC
MKKSLSLIAIATAVLAFTSVTTPAYAHSQLETASPAINAELKIAPKSVTLVFNEPVVVAARGVQLLDAKGKQLAASGAVNAAVVKFTIPKLKAGRYVLRWRVVSADSHVIVASYAFAVATPTKKAKPANVKLTDSNAAVNATFDGNGPGLRNVSVALRGVEGVLELKNPLFGAPMLWTLTSSGETMVAKGMLPSAGTWTITARVRVGQFDERVVVGKLVVAP